jgi:hypothetical protein
MNQLKKIFLGLAVVVALGLVGANNAAAQLTCSETAGNPIVRSAGITELVGTITSSCSEPGGSPATAATSITITLLPGAANITNGAALPTVSVDNAAGAAGAISANTVTFAIPPFVACAAVAPATCLHTIIVGVNPSSVLPATTVGMRVNIFASGIVFPAEVQELTTTPPNGVITLTNSQLNVATPLVGMNVGFGGTPAITSCATATLKGTPTVLTTAPTGVNTAASPFAVTDPVTGVIKAATAIQTVTAAEAFTTAFAVAGAGTLATGNGEGADSTQGTRVVISLGALPSNVLVVAANYITAFAASGLGGATGLASAGSNILTLALVPTADGNGFGGGTPVSTVAAGAAVAAGATVITGTTITYEAIVVGPATADSVAIPIGLYTTGTPGPAGTSTVSAQLGPVSTIGTSSVGQPIPRFGSAPTSGTLTVVVTCLTNIFFPWVANIVGYDTGFALSNTTTDPFGTASQSGTCVYNFYGSNAPSGGTFTTASFGGGKTDTQLLSIIAPGFSGYIIIQCNFQLGHGFDFIVNGFGGGTPTVGQGGPGMIMPQPTATSGGGSRKSAAAVLVNAQVGGEAFGH